MLLFVGVCVCVYLFCLYNYCVSLCVFVCIIMNRCGRLILTTGSPEQLLSSMKHAGELPDLADSGILPWVSELVREWERLFLILLEWSDFV